jgi:DNA-3-methyladenine glycosylase
MINTEFGLKLAEESRLEPLFFQDEDVDVVAQKLVGTILVFEEGEAGLVGGAIVETEAYDQKDPTAHCFTDSLHKPSKGSEPMTLPGGHAYVFPASYGYCLNFVTGRRGYGSAVLIRALKPLVGQKIMRIRRGPYSREALKNEALLCHGPVTLCESLGISSYQNEASLFGLPFRLYARRSNPQLASGPRIGVAATIEKHRPRLVGSSLAVEAIEANRRWADRAHLNCVKNAHGLKPA